MAGRERPTVQTTDVYVPPVEALRRLLGASSDSELLASVLVLAQERDAAMRALTRISEAVVGHPAPPCYKPDPDAVAEQVLAHLGAR